MKKVRVVAAVCGVVIGMQSIMPLAAQHTDIWKTSFQKRLLAQNNAESLLINKASLTMEAQEEAELEVTYRSGKELDKESIEWKSSNSDVVSVSQSGKIKAKKDGSATITAKLDGYTTTCEVTVKTELKDIRIMPTELDLEEGKRASLSVICMPSNISNIPEITWSSDNEDVVEVDDRGNLTAKKQGTATVTVQVGEFQKSSKITVKGEEIAVDAIHFTSQKVILYAGETDELELIFDPENTTVKSEVQWTSSDPEVVSVDNGKITANTIGETVITAEVSGKKTTCEIVVEEKEIPLESIKLSSSTVELEVGKKEVLTVSYDPEDTTDKKEVLWTSSDETVASVNENGEIEAINIGKAVITAEVSGIKKSCNVTVKEKVIELTSISFETDELSLKEGEETTLEITYDPDNATIERNVIWTSSDEAIVTVNNGVIKAVGVGEAVITAEVGDKQAFCDISVQKQTTTDAKLQYETYDSENGWLDSVGEGETAGTESFYVEAVRIRLAENMLGGGIRYSAYVQNVGWQSYVANGVMAGTTGKDQRLEAIKIKLTGSIASKYDIYYRSNVEGEGWLGWAKNGEASGSEGMDKQIYAIQIMLVEKGKQGPENQQEA